jgi:WXG100 family type VII secretion target
VPSNAGGGGALTADFAEMQEAIKHMASFQREVTACLDDVEQAMAALRATWHGAASDAQAQSQQQWQQGAEQMQAALTQLEKIAQTARSNYIDAVAKNSEMWDA